MENDKYGFVTDTIIDGIIAYKGKVGSLTNTIRPFSTIELEFIKNNLKGYGNDLLSTKISEILKPNKKLSTDDINELETLIKNAINGSIELSTEEVNQIINKLKSIT